VNALSDFQSITGRKHGLISFYTDWGYSFESVQWIYDAIIANGSTPMVGWCSYPGDKYPLSGIISGDFDHIIQAYATSLRNYGHTIFMRWGAEMNLTELPWTGYQNDKDPSIYVAAYRHIHDIYEQVGATNVLWVWSPNYASWPPEDWNDYNNYYPGDEYVDWIGVDGYNWGQSSLNSGLEWNSFDYLFADFFADVSARYTGKPQMIAEFASVEDDGGSKAAWIADAYGRMADHYPSLRAVVWFNEPVYDPTVPGWADFPVESSTSSLDAYRSAINIPYFSSEAPFE
jgi:endoglucanase